MITIDLVWYWLVLGFLAFGAATVQLIRHTTHSARFDVLAAALYVLSMWLAGAAVTRNVAFITAFCTPLGLAFALANWLSLKSRSKLSGQSREG